MYVITARFDRNSPTVEFLPPNTPLSSFKVVRSYGIFPFGTVYDPRKRNTMNRILSLSIIAILSITLSSCEIVGGIFKAGVWTGLIIVAVVLGLIIFLLSRGGRKD